MNHPFLVGHRVYLRGVTEEDVTGPMFQWTNDRRVTRFLFRGAWPNHPALARKQLAASLGNAEETELAVVELEADRVVGICGIHSLNWIARSGELRILIGEIDCWNQGIGTEVTQLMAAYAFEVLNLNKVWLGATAENVGAVRSYEKCGFRREGVLRQEVFRNGRYYDAVRFSMLVTEYRQLRGTWAINDKISEQFPE